MGDESKVRRALRDVEENTFLRRNGIEAVRALRLESEREQAQQHIRELLGGES